MFFPLNLWVRVQTSPIHGYGVFAYRFIPKGTKISFWSGVITPHQEFKKRYGTDIRYCYRCMWHGYIVDKERKNIITYVNDGVHGQSEPKVNCALIKRYLVALRDIEVGEEITLSYGKRYWNCVENL